MTSDATVRIVVSTITAQVFSPFEALGCIRTLPSRLRNWDAAEKCWVISLTLVPELKAALAAEGFKVVVRDAKAGRAESPRRGRAADTWADAMYAAMDKALADRAYKALLPVLHPDRGGDTEAMQALNAARDRAVSR
ncbi:hypothetical protein [Actinacidiphila oryziradicis]|uniref:Molecular chaperone DnaJ n=1 Tax=Actinacidiphila oryziradicis TaxID=2571141 RepID=A0A4U0SWU9_9ACTN|nr:hypothetical protein [Actinacidiphila oryziradicis]TKA13201.1 hypothetical protein FCI23_00190 [Actinacidiphila oryziradicis]